MKVINVRNQYDIHDDTLRTFDSLPAGVYAVEFHQMSGFHLVKHADIEISERVYGKHHEKVDKVLRAFANTQRNLGVILSGKKGIGKSLFAKLVSIKAIENGMPVILVDRYIPGIASYIESIEQECVVMFDEYDKSFGGVKSMEGCADTQTEMLTLFDGMAMGKKLFVITCNDLYRLSDYLVNRPGRFHYHFRFECPNEEEVREYMTDKLNEAYHGEIGKVVAFSKKVDLNYDCLRAIAFELNNGEPFEKAILDMNIVNTESYSYNAELRFVGGYKLTMKNVDLDLFDYCEDGEDRGFWLHDERGNWLAKVDFDPANVRYDMRGLIVSGDDIEFIGYRNGKEFDAQVEAVKAMRPEYLLLKRVGDSPLHYVMR